MVTVYIVLGVLYESYIHPVTILSTLPSAGVGAILALLILRAGTERGGADRHHSADRHREKERHHDDRLRARGASEGREDREDAIYQACLLRFRPIMMTTMAALLGGCRWRSATGIGSELRRPLGIAMVGGLIVSQVLTLYTTPVIYIFFERLAERRLHASAPGTGQHRRSVPAEVSHEHFRPIHSPAGCDHSADRGDRAGGGGRLPALPVAPLPQMDFPTISVAAACRERSPEIMASSVATPLERQFGRIAGVTEMTSSSYLGTTSITLQFDLNRNIDGAARDVQAAINAARSYLPSEPADQSHVSQGESGGRADHDSWD